MSTSQFDAAQHPREHQGGRFRAKLVDDGTGGVARTELATVLSLWGLESMPDALDGRTYEQVWDETMADTLLPAELQSVDQAIYAELGDDFDIGRHRSGPDLVWLDTAKPLNADDQWLIAGPDDAQWDDPAFTLAADFYTRNGGGNRECYCDGVCACTASAIDALQEHPAHLHDQDSGFDATYAYFRFAMPKEKMRDVLSADRVARRRRRALLLLERLTAGSATPWSILPENPETKLALDDASRRRGEAYVASRKFKAFDTGLRSAFDVEPQHLSDIEALEAWVAAGVGAAPAETASSGYLTRETVIAETRVRESQQAAATIALVEADMLTGAIPDHVLRLVQDGMKSSIGVRSQASRLDKNVDWRDRMTGDTAKTKAKITAVLEAREQAAAAHMDVQSLTRALTWPGAADTCPPELANETQDPDDLLGW